MIVDKKNRVLIFDAHIVHGPNPKKWVHPKSSLYNEPLNHSLNPNPTCWKKKYKQSQQ